MKKLLLTTLLILSAAYANAGNEVIMNNSGDKIILLKFNLNPKNIKFYQGLDSGTRALEQQCSELNGALVGKVKYSGSDVTSPELTRESEESNGTFRTAADTYFSMCRL